MPGDAWHLVVMYAQQGFVLTTVTALFVLGTLIGVGRLRETAAAPSKRALGAVNRSPRIAKCQWVVVA